MKTAREEFADIDPLVRELVGDYDFDLDELREKYAIERDKRLREDKLEQYLRVTAEFSHYADDPYVDQVVERDPVFDEVEVLIVGAGWGGVTMGVELRKKGFRDIRFIEKGGDFGGTWYWNRYPGIMCDTESLIYMQYLEELEYTPSHRYAFGDEIRAHIQRIADAYGLYDDALFQTKVTIARWDEAASQWVLGTDRGDEVKTRFLAIANGFLECPKLPAIPGINEFKGHTFHSSRWDYDYTDGDIHGGLKGLHDKRVGIVGTGATAIQIVPHLGEASEHLYVFQRTPAAVGVRANAELPPEWAKAQEAGWQEHRCLNFIGASLGTLDEEEDLIDDGFTHFGKVQDITASWASGLLGRPLTETEAKFVTEVLDGRQMEAIRKRIAEIVKDPKTAAGLMPWYRRACKRPQFHDEYLETFNRPNVTLVDTDGKGISRLTESAAVVGDVEYGVDCLIFASGFEVGTSLAHRTGYEIHGVGTRTLTEHWADGMKTLHGLMSHGFPNLFISHIGQNSTSANFSHMIRSNAEHAAYILSEVTKRGAERFEPTVEAVEEYVSLCKPSDAVVEFLGECTPGYYNSEGDPDNPVGFVSNLFSGGPLGFLELLESWRASGSLRGLALGRLPRATGRRG